MNMVGPLDYTLTYIMVIMAIMAITTTPGLMDYPRTDGLTTALEASHGR